MPKPTPLALIIALFLTVAGSILPLRAAASIAESLVRDCYVLKDGALRPIPSNTFAQTRLYVVYYSHRFCSPCIPVTEELTRWYSTRGRRPDVSLVFATLGERTEDQLLGYLKKSKILFPALHPRCHFAADGKFIVGIHPFYPDGYGAVPLFRFYRADGSEIDPRLHGAKPDGEEGNYGIQPKELDALIANMLKTDAKSMKPASTR